MTTETGARKAALDLLVQVDRGRRLDLALAETFRELPPRRRPWVHQVTYGTVRLRGRLDHILDHHLHQGVESVGGPLLEVLRMGVYQLLYMEGVPAYAAVSSSAELARPVAGEGGSRLVNAVLRSLAEEGVLPSLFPDPEEDPAGWLSTWGSHPRWLVERWLSRWSVEDVTALVESNNRIPSIWITPLGMPPEEAVEALREGGMEAWTEAGAPGSVRLPQGVDPGRALERVPGVVQDPAAARMARFVPVPATRIVADLCAAPGGKSLALAGRGAYVLAADRSAARLRVLRENADRLGLGRPAPGGADPAASPGDGVVWPVQALAEAPPLGMARVVLLDVPCSGTGTLRRHPDARWRLGPDDVTRLARVQARILDGAATAVGPGGTLVYATCTLEPEENEAQVDAFLARHSEFSLEVPGAGDAAGVGSGDLDDRGFLRILPWRGGFDGAFGARMRRAV